jgi:hypothetical protein
VKKKLPPNPLANMKPLSEASLKSVMAEQKAEDAIRNPNWGKDRPKPAKV